jgi:DegV family protein with EDD domain
MSKVAILTDSNSGITQAAGKELGISVLPMPFYINDELYYEDITLSQEQFYEHLEADAEIHTSMPVVGDVLDCWDSLLKEYDEIVYIPMSSGLSSSCATAVSLSEDYDGRVQVVNNQRISVTQRQSALDARVMADSGLTGAEIKSILEETKFDSHIYIMVDTLTYLKKGGRITPAAAMIGGVLHLKPVLQIQGEKLDAFSKCRSIKNAKKIMTDAVAEGIEQEFGGIAYADKPGAWIGLAHTHNEEAALQYVAETKERFPGFDVHMDRLPISIACHIGPGSLALTCTKVLPQGAQYS